MNPYELYFLSRGTRCGARLFLPHDVAKPPVVVMAHGFAAWQEFRLPAFAEKFVRKGLGVMTFDYRNFGLSDGEPRNLVSPGRHVEDWRAAIACARGLEQVDGSRIGLWGTSFSGGHVLTVAAEDPGIAAVVSQIPFVDGLSVALNFGLLFNLTCLWHGVVDGIASMFGRTHFVPVVSDPDRFGLMNTPESKPGYLALVPENSGWENRVPARIALSLAAYRPVRYADRITCPVLMICAEKDTLIPQQAVRKCASRIRSVRLEVLPAGHFEPYVGELFERTATMEAEFLAGVLLPG
ncbi:MAG: alpha/beta hydrolase [Thermodesulfobacteriota bacterium]